MAIKYDKFEMPKEIKVEVDDAKPNFARFIAEPLERGYGHTVGNALRRILLTSLESPSILSIRIEEVMNEYTAIEGVIEDMTHIVLNFKTVLLRKLPDTDDEDSKNQILSTKKLNVMQDLLDKNNGVYEVTIGELLNEQDDVEVINPEAVMFKLTRPFDKSIHMCVGFGRGYVSCEKHEVENKEFGEVFIDACFSPVRLVNYFVENTRVGRATDYDKLILDIHTDGRITPKEAVSFSMQLGIMHFKIFEKLKEKELVIDKPKIKENKEKEEILKKLALKIDEIELSVRSTNCLFSASISTIGELVVMPESDMLRFRNFGKKSLTEIRQKLADIELSLGMDLSKYGINKDNIKQIIEKYLNEKSGEE